MNRIFVERIYPNLSWIYSHIELWWTMARIRTCHGLRMPGTFWIGSGPWFRLEFGWAGEDSLNVRQTWSCSWLVLQCECSSSQMSSLPVARIMCMYVHVLLAIGLAGGTMYWRFEHTHDSNHLDSTQINIDMYSYIADHDSVVFCGTIVTFCTNHFSSSLCWWDLMSLESLDWFISF